MIHTAIRPNPKDVDPSLAPRHGSRDRGEDSSETGPARPGGSVPVLPIDGAVGAGGEDGDVVQAPGGRDDFGFEDSA
jgi:hypothetical protein